MSYARFGKGSDVKGTVEMINFENRTIKIGKTEEAIERWGVLFQTPTGLYESLDEAVDRMNSLDLAPYMTIRPVAVAYCASTYEVYNT